MQEIGIAATQKHVRRLTELLIEGVDDLGGTVVTPRNPNERGALVCIKSTDAERLVDELGREGIVTSSRDGNLRVSLHAYNTPEDVKTVLWELGRKRELARLAVTSSGPRPLSYQHPRRLICEHSLDHPDRRACSGAARFLLSRRLVTPKI